MSLYVTLANGDILFHKKNDIPPPDWPSVSFFRDHLNPWLFHPKFVDCPARVCVNRITKCKLTYAAWTCSLKKNEPTDEYGETITPAICKDCTINPLLQIGVDKVGSTNPPEQT